MPLHPLIASILDSVRIPIAPSHPSYAFRKCKACGTQDSETASGALYCDGCAEWAKPSDEEVERLLEMVQP